MEDDEEMLFEILNLFQQLAERRGISNIVHLH